MNDHELFKNYVFYQALPAVITLHRTYLVSLHLVPAAKDTAQRNEVHRQVDALRDVWRNLLGHLV